MGLRKQSLELIILAPVLGFLILAGAGIHFLILTSVQEFSERSIRQSFRSLSDGLYSIADREVDRLSWTGRAGDVNRTTVRQVFALYDIESFARKHEIGVLIYSPDEIQPLLKSGISEDVPMDEAEGVHQDGNYLYHAFLFKPWDWRITLVKDSSAYASLIKRTQNFYIAAATILILIAAFLVIYLRRNIARPIYQIVTSLREGRPPEYSGINEFEYLSQNLGEMMQEIKRHRDNLEKLVAKRTAQLQIALDNMPGGMFMVGADLAIQVSNDQFPEIYGLPRDLFQEGCSLRDAVRFRAERGDYGLGAVDELVEKRLRGYTDREPLRLEERGPEGRVVEFFRSPTEDGGTVAVVIDISERKRAEEALAEKTGFLRLTEVITRAANEATSSEGAMQITLKRVCDHTSWPVGHVYAFDAASGDMAPTTLWHVPDKHKFETFRSITEASRFAPGIGLPGRVLGSRKPVWIADVTKDANFPRAALAKDIGVKSAFGFPVLVGKEVAAVLEFYSDQIVEPYEPLLEVMAQIGTQLGRTIEREHAKERMKSDLERLQEELRSARELQLAMVPSLFPPPITERPLQFAAQMEPASAVGGDFYNVLEIDKHKTGIVIADVSGKGARAALFMARALTTLNAIARRGGSPKSVVTQFNDELCAEHRSEMYVTVFYGVFDSSRNLFTYVNAGHYSPLLLTADGTVTPLEQVGGAIAGLIPDLTFDEGILELSLGNTLFCYTDGVIDAINAAGEHFSEVRLRKLLAGCDQLDADNLISRVMEEIVEFIGETPQIDDVTCLVMRRLAW
jgi:serine phosphatase RsbU (regulator of sigma subunit)/PAS domain-containing protein